MFLFQLSSTTRTSPIKHLFDLLGMSRTVKLFGFVLRADLGLRRFEVPATLSGECRAYLRVPRPSGRQHRRLRYALRVWNR